MLNQSFQSTMILKKAHFGKLNLTNDKTAMQIDSFYQELSESHPELFPDSIINSQDQLGKIADVQNSIVKNESKLSAFTTNNTEYKQFAREEFNKALDSLKAEVKKKSNKQLPTKNEQANNNKINIMQNLNKTEEIKLPVKNQKSGILTDENSDNYKKEKSTRL